MYYGETLYNLAEQILDLDPNSDTVDEKTKKQCEELLQSFKESFNRKKANEFLKKRLYDKINDPRNKKISSDSRNKTYENIKSDFENNRFLKNWPSRDTIIKMCFDFFNREELLQEVDGVRLLDALFDNMYQDRLNLKNKNDLCYYFFLVNCCITKENRRYEYVKNEFIKRLPKVQNDDTDNGRKFTQEIREEVDSFVSEDDFKEYIEKYPDKPYITVKYTAKKEFVDEFNRIVNEIHSKDSKFSLIAYDKEYSMDIDKSFLALIARLSKFLDGKNLLDEENEWLKIIFGSFIPERLNGKVDLCHMSLKRKAPADDKKKSKRKFSPLDPELTVTTDNYNIEEYIFDGNLSRGMYLFFAIYEADALVNEEKKIDSIYSYKKFINEKLDHAGFATLNQGVLLDRIAMDLIDYRFDEKSKVDFDIIVYLDCVFKCIIDTYYSR